MPQYYANQDVICWVKAFITEAYEGALDEEQKTDLRKDFYKVIHGWHTETTIYDWAWNMIAVPFGIEDQFPETFVTALYKSWMASVDDDKDNPKQFSEELRDIFDEDKEDDEEECDCGDCERCLADDTCVARCGDRGRVTVIDQNGKECLVCEECLVWFKNKVKGYEAEQKAFEAQEAETCVKCNNAFTFEDNFFKGFNRETGGDRMCQNCFAEEEAEEAEKKVNLTIGA